MANEAYITKGTALRIDGAAGADYAFSVEGIATGTGQVSAQIDLGAAPREALYAFSCEVVFAATPTKYYGLDLYVAGAPDGDSTQIDGDVGASDAAITASHVEATTNLKFIGTAVAQTATSSVSCVTSGVFMHTERYLSIVAVNSSGASVVGGDTQFRFDLQPVAWQGQ